MTPMLQNPIDHVSDPPRSSAVRDRIACLETAPRAELTAEWRRAYRCAPPKGASRRMLVGAVAYALQMRQHGLSETRLRRRLERHDKEPSRAMEPAPQLRPGARLIREWNGATHTVDVTERGYRWNGKIYRSLSAIARTITGTRWSGPRFFGLGKESAQ